MNCVNCGFENQADARFCKACGIPLPRLCGGCGEVNPARFKFCGACGAPLSSDVAVDAAAAGPPARRATDAARDAESADPERRHLTVMFCDLVGSTRLSLALDPEELRDVIRAYQAACTGVIEQFGGYVAQYLGDGVLVYFGYPVALEDEAGRAVGAGLGIVGAIRSLGQRLKVALEIDLAVRIGIHTGVVVVGEVGGGARREHLALGDTPNIAARLQSVAVPNTVVISGETYRLIARTFECEELGARPIKGLPGPEPLYRVIGERAEHTEAANGGRPATILGREHELKLLLDRWERVRQGSGRVVCISGDPGIGKSHLIHELKARAALVPCRMLDARCLPYQRNTAFHPFIDLLQRELDLHPDQSGEAQLSALADELQKHDIATDDALPLLAGLLSIPADYARPVEPPALTKERTKALLVQLLLGIAREEPLILTIQDLQWSDPSTLELLDQLLVQVESSPLLALFTFRPEFGVRWGSHVCVTHLYLGRLHQRQVEALVMEVAGGKRLPAEVLAQIVARTDGVPLFVEELTKMLLESGLLEEREDHYALRGALPPLAIPNTLRDSLEARLDRLSTVKELAQLGATIGREFSHELLEAVAGMETEALDRALAELVDAGLLFGRGTPPHATYVFKHALIQEAAYQSLLRSTRQRHHQMIATALAERFPEVVEAEPELLAHHYTAAGVTDRAIEAWLSAGRHALERSANAEAVAHLTQGRDLLEGLTDADQREAAELELLCTLAPALAATRGYTASEVLDVYGRARVLCERAGRLDALVQVLVGLFAYHFVRAELRPASAIATQLLRIADRQGVNGDAHARLAADAAMGVSSLATGALAAAHEHLERVIRAYDPARHARLAITFGQDFGVVALAYSALLLWLSGCPDQARSRADQAVALAERLHHPHSIALALSLGASVHCFARDAAAVAAWAHRLDDLAAAQGFGHWQAEARFLLAWVAAEEGRPDEALEVMEAQIAAFRALDSLMPFQYHFRSLAELHARAGRPEQARALLDELERTIETAGEGWWWESEVYRARGDVMTMLDDEAAEAAYGRALEVARARRARSLELRAAIGLARLWIDRGRTADARALLSDCYEGFTEGFDTGDLRETRALLRQLDAHVVV